MKENAKSKETSKFAECIYWNDPCRTYGSAIIVNKWLLRSLVFVIAALPLFTSWMFAIIPKITDWKIRF
jgi:hypothetical protein